jgi:diguanylate cyclase (GGDEF)-like protein
MSTPLSPAVVAALASVLPEPVVVVAAGTAGGAHTVAWVNEAAVTRLESSAAALLGRPVVAVADLGHGDADTALVRLIPGDWLWQSLPHAMGETQYWWVRGFAISPEITGRNVQSAAALTTPAAWARLDRLTGLLSGQWFHELAERDWALAQREARAVTLIRFNVDTFGAYNATFGRAAGDAALRKVGFALHSGLRRPSDLLSRLEGGRFLAMAAGMPAEAAHGHAARLVERVFELQIHHPRSHAGRYLSVSAGVFTHVPQRGELLATFQDHVDQALLAAQTAGGNGVMAVSL